jgi:hypothetical protein
LNKLIYLITFLTISFYGCSQTSEKKNFDSVRFDVFETKTVPDVDPESKMGSYGPVNNEKQLSEKEQKNVLLGILIGPGLYKSVMALNAIECMERYDKRIAIVSGVGFGALVAADYVAEPSVEKVKWQYYKRIKKAPDANIFDSSWIKYWNKHIAEIDEKKIKTSRVSLWLPHYSSSKKQVGYTSKFDLKESLYEEINDRSPNYMLKKQFINKDAVESLPIDRLVVLDSLGDNIKLKNNYLFGVFSKASAFIKNISNHPKVRVISLADENDVDSRTFVESYERDFCKKVEEALK